MHRIGNQGKVQIGLRSADISTFTIPVAHIGQDADTTMCTNHEGAWVRE